MTLSIFTLFCNHPWYPSPELFFIFPNLNSLLINKNKIQSKERNKQKTFLIFHCPQSLGTTILLSVAMNVATVGSSCKCNYAAFVFF